MFNTKDTKDTKGTTLDLEAREDLERNFSLRERLAATYDARKRELDGCNLCVLGVLCVGGLLTDPWNPAQYDKFKREREQPFFDLMAMVRPAPAMRIVDLGCGTGALTRQLHARLAARQTLGLD